jgi:hypothetical protein
VLHIDFDFVVFDENVAMRCVNHVGHISHIQQAIKTWCGLTQYGPKLMASNKWWRVVGEYDKKFRTLSPFKINWMKNAKYVPKCENGDEDDLLRNRLVNELFAFEPVKVVASKAKKSAGRKKADPRRERLQL